MTDKQALLWAFGYNPADIAKVDHIPLPTLRNILENIEVCQDDPNYKPVAQDYFRTEYGMVKGPVDLNHAAPEARKILAEVQAGNVRSVYLNDLYTHQDGPVPASFRCENGYLDVYVSTSKYRWTPRHAYNFDESVWFDDHGNRITR